MSVMVVVVVAGAGCDLCCCDVGVCVCVCVCVSGNAVGGRRRRCRYCLAAMPLMMARSVLGVVVVANA